MTKLSGKPSQDAATGKQRPVATAMVNLRPDTKLLSLIMVYFTVFVDFLGVALLIPIIPFLVGTSPHEDAFSSNDMGGLEPGAASALIMLTFNGAQLISTIIFGPMSDRVGRKPILLASLIGGTAGYAFQGIAIWMGSFWILLASRAFTGLFGGTRPVAIAYIADAAPPAQRAKLLGMLALAVMLAMQFGPVLGGSLGLLSLSLPCYIAAVVSGIGGMLVSSLVKEARLPGSKAADSTSQQAETGDRVAFNTNFVLSFFAGTWVMSHVFGQALLLPSQHNFDPNQVGLASLGDGVAILLANPLYMFLIRRVRLPTVCLIGSVLMILQAICPHVAVAPLLIARYISGFGTSLLMPGVSAIVGAIAPAHKRGAWSGMTIASQNLGRTVSPILIGLTFDVDYHLPFWINSGVAVLCCVTAAVLIPRVPMATEAPAAAATKDGKQGLDDVPEEQSGEYSQSVAATFAFESELSLKTEALIEKLQERRDLMQKRLTMLANGEDDVLAPPMASPEKFAECRVELANWFTGTLEARGYNNWPEHLDGVKLILTNSFPPLRTTSQIDKVVDLISVLEGHIMMAENSSLFNGVEDLVHSIP
mmetsp:Transcript_58926/g.140652  ORF Transcript_58926/g.140652 Transcript_58926/m.140652 type:complete len:592 (+) Transcript_58926:74-1849(+)